MYANKSFGHVYDVCMHAATNTVLITLLAVVAVASILPGSR